MKFRPTIVNGTYRIGEHHAVAWPHIRRLHLDLIYKAAFYGQRMDYRSHDNHAPGILKHLRNTLGVHVPDPLPPPA